MGNEIDALIAKCEAAQGPDREIDAAFHALMNGYPFRFENGGTQMFYRHADEKAARWHAAFEAKEGQTVGYLPYTSSLDSIVALIERELPVVHISITIDPSGNGCYIVHWPDGLSGGPHAPEVNAAHVTPALACCLCFLTALRAKRSIDGDGK
jgi:hypothetical protein